MTCLIHAGYNMKADVYEQTGTQNQSGQVLRDWNYGFTVSCIARAVLGGGIRVVGSTERWTDDYEPVDWMRMRTGVRLNKRQRIKNIRSFNPRSGEASLMWLDEHGNDIMFDVQGVNPINDPFGTVIEYEVLAKRVVHER